MICRRFSVGACSPPSAPRYELQAVRRGSVRHQGDREPEWGNRREMGSASQLLGARPWSGRARATCGLELWRNHLVSPIPSGPQLERGNPWGFAVPAARSPHRLLPH